MSYILDALRRADAERDRGAVPGLHANTAPADSEAARRPDRRPGLFLVVGGLMLILAVAAVAFFGPWRAVSRPEPERLAVAPAATVADTAEPGVRTAAPSTSAPNGTDRRLAELEARARMNANANVPAPAAIRPPAAPVVEHYGAPLGRVGAVPSLPVPRHAQSTDKTAGTDVPAAAEAPASRKLDNPPSAAPHFAVGGSIYSDTPSARMLILNGQVYHEGDRPAADTRLEQIRPKSAVLSFRGTRYEIGF